MASARAIQEKEREVQIERVSRMLKRLLLSAATIMTFAVAVLLVADSIYKPSSFAISQVKISGNFEYLSAKEIQSKVMEEEPGNFFSVDLAAIQKRIELLSWVRTVNVRREWPNSLSIRVTEHKPVMRWRELENNSQLAEAEIQVQEQWVSTSGKVVSINSSLPRTSPVQLAGVSKDAPKILEKALVWQRSLASLGLELREVALTPSQAWHLQVAELGNDQSFDLLLGRRHVEDRLKRFAQLFLAEFSSGEYIILRADARYPDGLAMMTELKPKPEIDEEAELSALSSNAPKNHGLAPTRSEA